MQNKPSVRHGKKLPGLSGCNGELFSVHAKITQKNNASSVADRNQEADEMVSREFNEGKNQVKDVENANTNTNFCNDVTGKDDTKNNDSSSEDDKEIDDEYFAPPQPQNYFISTEQANTNTNFCNDVTELHGLQNSQVDTGKDDTKNNDSSSKDEKKMDELQNIIKELIATEETYVDRLRMLIEQYTQQKHETNPVIFGNIEVLYAECLNFLAELKQNSGNVHRIAHTFINAKSTLFDSYIQYLGSRSKFNECYIENIKAMDKELQNPFDLRTYLTLPSIRLANYNMILQRLQQLMIQSSDNIDDSVNDAINIIQNTMKHSDELLGLNSIKFWKTNIETSGLFMMMGEFRVLKPSKYNATIFLFENDVVFTKTPSGRSNEFVYMDHIKFSDLTVSKMEHDDIVFHVTDCSKFITKAKGEAITYVLEAKNKDIKKEWTQKLEAMLWKKLHNEKAKQKRSRTFRDGSES